MDTKTILRIEINTNTLFSLVEYNVHLIFRNILIILAKHIPLEVASQHKK